MAYVPERFQFKLCVHVCNCLHCIAQKYMIELFLAISTIEVRSRLHSALDVPHRNCQHTGKGLSHMLVHQHGTHCPTTLKIAACLLSCLNKHERHLFSEYKHTKCIRDVCMIVCYINLYFHLHYMIFRKKFEAALR